MNSNNIIIFFCAILLSFQAKSQTKDSMLIESNIRLFSFQNIEYAVLKISYKNCGRDTAFLWTQNWKIHYLYDEDKGVFKNCPRKLNGGMLNAVSFYKSPRSFSSKGLSTDYQPNDTLLNCSFIRKIIPNDVFYSTIVFSDTSIISYLKHIKPNYIILHYSVLRDYQAFLGIEKKVFYKDDELFIYYENNPDKVSCLPANVTNSNGIVSEKDFDTLLKIHTFEVSKTSVKLIW